MVYEKESRVVSLIIAFTLLLIIMISFLLYSAPLFSIHTYENNSKYNKYVQAATRTNLHWKASGGWVCSYSIITWDDDYSFVETGDVDTELTLKMDGFSEWSSEISAWRKGPIDIESEYEFYLNKQIRNCLSFSFGRKPDIREIASNSADWIRVLGGSTGSSIVTISNERRTLESFSTSYD